MTVDDILSHILKSEGGFVDDPKDLGGATNYGITQKTLSDYRKRQVTKEEVRALTVNEAKDIYRQNYVAPFMDWSANMPLLSLLVDSAVQHGVGRVKGWLSELQSPDPEVVRKSILKRRIRFYGEIITTRPDNAKFAKGWMNRVTEFI